MSTDYLIYTYKLEAQTSGLFRTPIVNSLADVYSYLRFLRVRPWYDWDKFNYDIAKLEKKRRELNFVLAMERKMIMLTSPLSAQLAATRLQKIMVTFLLRRKKDTKLDDKPLIELPPKEVVLKRLEFTEEEREIYSMVSNR